MYIAGPSPSSLSTYNYQAMQEKIKVASSRERRPRSPRGTPAACPLALAGLTQNLTSLGGGGLISLTESKSEKS
jgi:hypothetical protein